MAEENEVRTGSGSDRVNRQDQSLPLSVLTSLPSDLGMPNQECSIEYSLPAFVCLLPPSLSPKRMTGCHRSAQWFPLAAACLSRPLPTWECECSRDSQAVEEPKDFHV